MKRTFVILFFAGTLVSLRPAWTQPESKQEAEEPEEGGREDYPAGDLFHPGLTKSLLVVPRTPIERFRTDVIDAHSHPYAKTAEAVAEWVRLKDQVGVRTSLILTNETGAEFLR